MTSASTTAVHEDSLNRPSRKLWRYAVLLAFVALASGVLLTGTSVWFLGAVAIAGAGPMAFTFNFHIPAALVRLFAVSRTVAKYGERLVGHRAALIDQVSRRSELFLAMSAAPGVLRAGWQLARQDRLSDYIDDVEDVDFARLRVPLPLTGLLAGVAVLAVLTAALAPLALVPIALLAAVMLLAQRRIVPALVEDRRWAEGATRDAAMQFGSALSAIVPLRAEGAWPDVLKTSFTGFERAERAERQSRDRLVWIDTLARMAGPLAAMSVMFALWVAGLSGDAMLPGAFVAFAWLALGEAASGVSRIAAGHARDRVAGGNLDQWAVAGMAAPSQSGAPATGMRSLSVKELPRTAPDGSPLGGTIGLDCHRGRPVALIGPSGCGKTTLLKQIAGWLPSADESAILVDGEVVEDRRAIACLGLHDAAILTDTIRENFFAPGRSDDALWEALVAVELDERIKAAGGLDVWVTQDKLSLGEAQRLNLARAWLSDAPLILLDEPTEHLAAAQAKRILKRFVDHFDDRLLVLSTHHREALPAAAIDVVDMDMKPAGGGAGGN